MSKVIFFAAAVCCFAAVAFAGTVGTTCENGITLLLDQLYQGDTRAFDTTSINCGSFKYSPKGMWYTYTADEDRSIHINTCDQRTSFDSIIFVFSSCDTTRGFIDQCITMNDDGCNKKQASVKLNVEKGQTYHIFVAGFLNASGIFYLSTSEILPPDNYQCTSAIEVPDSSVSFSIEGETGTCLNVWDNCTFRRSAGLWYKVKGNGGSFLAHTCNQNTNYDTVISVFSECDNTIGGRGCIGTNNDACYRASLVQWRSVMNSEYYVFVTGFQNARGRFTLAIEPRTLNANSYCYEPIVVDAIPYYYNGQTDYMSTTYSECRNVEGQHSMFFRIQGMNRKIVITTCTSSSTVNDSVIDVYSQCEFDAKAEHGGSGISCVASNDDYCGLGAQVVFFATSDTYYVAISSASSSIQGVSFSLAIVPYDEVKNSQCWYAKDLDSMPDILLGNTTQFDECEQSCDGSKVKRRGGWWRYKHTGSSKTVTATTCNSDNALNARIEVYRDCSEMACVAQASPKDGCTNATFVVENGKTYNIFVTGDSPSDQGYFHVDFYEEEPNLHSTCEEAYFVNRGALPYRLEDNTIMCKESVSGCTNKTSRGVWVSVIGTGNKIVATTCDPNTGYDTLLELYDHCPSETEPGHNPCMRTNDDNPACSRSSEIEWASNSGQYYWIFVTGFAGSTGIFVLNIYEKASMINAQCQNAVGIRSLPYYDYGMTTYCDVSQAECKKSVRKGNWYKFNGNDHWVTLSTCNKETDFATEIEVYLGCNDDGGKICVAHNHDYSCSPKTEITFAALKDEVFYIFITGADDTVMAEGFFGLTVTQGERLPRSLYGISSSEEGLTGFEGFMISVGVLMGIGALCAAGAVGYGVYKRRHLSYQEISTAG